MLCFHEGVGLICGASMKGWGSCALLGYMNIQHICEAHVSLTLNTSLPIQYFERYATIMCLRYDATQNCVQVLPGLPQL